MAGIGFELQRLLKRGTLLATIQAFVYGAMVASGPMILTVIAVSVIGWLSRSLLSDGALKLFTLTITYTFAFSLILTAPFQQLLTRYIADRYFAKDLRNLFGGFMTITAFVLGLALLVSGTFYRLLIVTVPLDNVALYKIAGVVVFIGQCFIWQLMAFISTSKEYQKIFLAYILGTIASITSAFFFIKKIGVVGALAAYGVGQWLIALIIFWIVIRGLNKRRWVVLNVFKTFKQYPLIALNGFFMTLGIWIDKFVFYAHVRQTFGGNLFYSFTFYDVPSFLALMSLVPAMTYFLILAETHFYTDFKKFIDNVLHHPLLKIEQKKHEMLDSLQTGMWGIARIQGVFSLLVIIFAGPLVIFLGYQGLSIPLFRILILASFFYILTLTLNVFYLYFEFRKEALIMSMTFCIGNALFTHVTALLGTRYYGLGMLISALGTLLFFWPHLIRKVSRIDYMLFSQQPIEDAFETSRRAGVRRWLRHWKRKKPTREHEVEWTFTSF
ncbi:MAG: exopolysaccharide Pel transporter PelG [candidate division KSB1 bacterium]|nr:exopolysaccharide Pel transporter PelG [candidate division KSB1 bacterium]